MNFQEMEKLIDDKERYEAEILDILSWGNWKKKDWNLEEDKELQNKRNIFFVKNREFLIQEIDKKLSVFI